MEEEKQTKPDKKVALILVGILAAALIALSFFGLHKVRLYKVQWKENVDAAGSGEAVLDTTPPRLETADGVIYLNRATVYGTGAFVSKAEDESGRVEVFLRKAGDNALSDTVCFSRQGSYTVELCARDRSGNETVKTVDVFVDLAPVFGDMADCYIALNEEYDFLSDATAYDNLDGDLTDKILLDESELRLDTEGTYNLVFSVSDQYGLTAKKELAVHVCEPLELQKRINQHEINRKEQTIIGAPNLYDSGIWEGDDLREMMEYYKPCVVRIRKDIDGRYSYGSGYIIRITDEDVLIGTNAHVVREYETMDVYFYDGTKCVCEIIGKGNGTVAENDVAFVRVKRSDIPEQLMDNLMTVHIDKGLWDDIPQEPADYKIAYLAIDEQGNPWHFETGVMEQKVGKAADQEKEGFITEVTVTEYGGTSGSAILDSHGNLVSMIALITYDDDYGLGNAEYWGTCLDRILVHYEQIVGESAYYQ